VGGLIVSGNVGVGTAAPTAKLDVAGGLKATAFTLTGNGAAAGKVLTSDATGVASWQTAAGGGGAATLGANTFSATQTISNGNLVLPTTTSFSSGLILQNDAPLIHSFGTSNTFIGLYSGNFTLTGTANTGMGKSALSGLGLGDGNSAIGFEALYGNLGGSFNTASGYRALYANLTGSSNVASGAQALRSNTSGANNTANGAYALETNSMVGPPGFEPGTKGL
jgi:trimeric autotransporter adhesin